MKVVIIFRPFMLNSRLTCVQYTETTRRRKGTPKVCFSCRSQAKIMLPPGTWFWIQKNEESKNCASPTGSAKVATSCGSTYATLSEVSEVLRYAAGLLLRRDEIVVASWDSMHSDIEGQKQRPPYDGLSSHCLSWRHGCGRINARESRGSRRTQVTRIAVQKLHYGSTTVAMCSKWQKFLVKKNGYGDGSFREPIGQCYRTGIRCYPGFEPERHCRFYRVSIDKINIDCL